MARRFVPSTLVLTLLAAIVFGTWLYFRTRSSVSTDDAYIESPLVIVSARVPGPVSRVHVQDNEEVREGQVLIEIDPSDYEIRVDQARAAVAMAAAGQRAAQSEVPLARDTVVTRIQQARATLAGARVAVNLGRAQTDEARARLEARRAAQAAAQADGAVAEAALDKTRMDLERAGRLVAQGLIAVQDHETAQIAHRSAQAVLQAARRRLTQAEREAEQAEAEVRRRVLAVDQAERRAEEAEALLAESESQRTQEIVKEAGVGRASAGLEQARADLAAAELQLAKTRVVAPLDGFVSKKTVEPGQLVQPGQPLLAIVPLHRIWVIANFKETQLTRVRQGQRATVAVDSYPERLFQGTVDSISAGTGARFSLLPPENATGNWVKVVQRVPVKIVLDSYKANPHVLRPGMSATVTIDVR